jgi:5-methylthioadenosine/S-adenosylhomocysteine deaminase
VANTLLRGAADDVPLEKMLETSFAVDAKLTRRDVQVGALLGCLEMLKSGTTSFVDLFYWEDEVARAVREAGIRGFLAWTVLDPQFTTQRGVPVKNAEQFVRKHKGHRLVTPMVGVMGVYVCSEEAYLAAKDVADREDVLLHGHLSETRTEVYEHERKAGARPVEWLDAIGFLGPRFSAAHCVWVTINEVRILARTGVAVAHCPVSNMKLASGGVAPVPEMQAEGVAVGLGTDSPLSNNGLDMFSDMKTCSLLHKATRWDASVLPAQKILDLATIDGAKVLHRERDLGSIEVGKRADLAVVDLRRPHATPFYPANLISHLVYSCRGGDIRTTIVDGVIRVADGRVVGVDEAEVLSRAQEIAAELFG